MRCEDLRGVKFNAETKANTFTAKRDIYQV